MHAGPVASKVLFMMPCLTAPSEVWMQRMLKYLEKDIATILVRDGQGTRRWNGRVRVVELARPSAFSATRFLRRVRALSTHKAREKVLRDEIRNQAITHVLCHFGDFALEFMDVWCEAQVPLFVHFHGYDATFDLRLHNQPNRPYFPETYRKGIKDLAGRATLIANSEFTKKLLVDEGISGADIPVKHLGVPIPPKAKAHLTSRGVRVLHLGRLVDFKSPDRTIKAFEIAKSRGLDGRLTIAGDGPLRVTCELLKLRSEWRDSIEILGPVTAQHAGELIAAADVFTQHNIKGEISRQSECLGVSVIEAMAAGLAVVGTRSGGVLETVVDGTTGVLVDPGDVEGQASALLHLSNDPDLRQRLGHAARIHVKQHFGEDREARALRLVMGLGV